MTPEQKFRKLWEAVEGNCWHEWVEKPAMICGVLRQCIHCKEVAENHQPFLTNPTLTLDVLFEIAKKLGYTDIRLSKRKVTYRCHIYGTFITRSDSSRELALLDALYQAIKDK